MRHLLSLAIVLALAGCASNTEKAAAPAEATTLPFPKAIYVYDFAVAPAPVPSGTVAAGQLSGAVDDPAKTEQRDKLEGQIADQLASDLVAELTKLGLPAVRWRGTLPLNDDAYVLEGQFLTIGDTGAPDQKIVGLGLGGAELRVLAQAYRLQGRQKV